MIKNKIIVVGDSFTYGHGCSDRIYYYDEKKKDFVGWFFQSPKDPPSKYCWASLMAQEYPQYEVINLSSPGNANMKIFSDLFEYCYKNGSMDVKMIIYAGSFSDRIEIAGHLEDEIFPWVVCWDAPQQKNQRPGYVEAKAAYRKHLYTPRIGEHQTVSALLAAHSFATSRKIDFLWASPDGALPFGMSKMFNPIKDTKMMHLFDYDFSGKREEMLCVDRHHNEEGHRIYYEEVVSPAVKKVL